MNFYEVAILKSPLQNLTYQSKENINIGLKVLVQLANRKNLIEAVIVKNVEKPEFNCSNILEISNEFYSSFMLEIALFISKYYICSLGYALSIFQAFNKNILNEKIDITINSKIELSAFQQKAKDE